MWSRKNDLVEEAQRGLVLFRERFWRCEALNASGTRRCKNYGTGHKKGHQFDDAVEETSPGSFVDIQDGTHKCSWEPGKFKDQLWA